MTWRSPAYLTFKANIARQASFHEMVQEQITWMTAEVSAVRREAERIAAGEIPSSADEMFAMMRRHGEVKQRVADFEAQFGFLNEWDCVMVVTFTETYLQDVLAYFAALDSRLMGDSEQSATYAEIAAAGSVEALAAELRDRWARNFVDDGGPRRWIGRLRRMGASALSEDLVPTMEELWGVRHLVVHRAGAIAHDFLRRHPQLGGTVGEQIRLAEDAVTNYVLAAWAFVESVDGYFALRYADRLPAGDAGKTQ
ncbi:MAG TPA: hypothetical protein VGR37_20120 [Longimicrobiaceae bacterium]|nr:hypothetical protein [Longimicrobiaceae bacterium]